MFVAALSSFRQSRRKSTRCKIRRKNSTSSRIFWRTNRLSERSFTYAKRWWISCFSNERTFTFYQRVQKQLSNAQEKLERAQKHAEDRKVASQKTIDRLQREYDEMAIERRENDKQVEELRGEANELETKVGAALFWCSPR
jgi:predicted RNase H-like nuclease (RuvC/YqgF family)